MADSSDLSLPQKEVWSEFFTTMPSTQRDNTVWHKRVLIPMWTIRLFVVVFLFVIYALSLATVETDSGDSSADRTLSSIWRLGRGQEVALCVFLGLCAATDTMGFLLFFSDNLTPAIMVASNSFQLMIWLAMVVVQGISVTKGSTAVGLGVSFVPFMGYLIVLIYAIIVWYRKRTLAATGDYAPAVNPANQVSYSVPTPYGANHPNSSYEPYSSDTLGSIAGALGKKKNVGEYYAVSSASDLDIRHV